MDICPFWFRVRFMVFNITFNNILAISWRWVLLVEETRVPGVNYRPAVSHWQPCLKLKQFWKSNLFILQCMVQSWGWYTIAIYIDRCYRSKFDIEKVSHIWIYLFCDFGGIVDRHWLNFLYKICWYVEFSIKFVILIRCLKLRHNLLSMQNKISLRSVTYTLVVGKYHNKSGKVPWY
jgi:hypothetical protein